MSDINIVLENRDDIHVAVEEKDINVEVPAGKDGRSLRPRGEWSASAAYAYLDLVSYEGSSYVALKAVPAGTLPTDTSYWMLSAEKGEPCTPEWGAITGDLSDQTDLQEALDAKADVIISSASGSIASFSDGSASPVTALSVGIEPVQDLHGYDNPWPAGGGKNLLNPSLLVVGTFRPATGEQRFDVNNRVCTQGMFFVKAGTYTFSVTSNQQIVIYVYDTDGTFLPEESLTNWDDYKKRTITLSGDRNVSAGYRFTNDGVITVADVVNPQLELGSSATSYTPYSNICPITGWDEAVVTRTGKSLLEPKLNLTTKNGVTFTENNDGTITTSGAPTANFSGTYPQPFSTDKINRLKPGTYRLSGCPSGGSSSTYKLAVWNQTTASQLAVDYGSGATFTIPETSHLYYVRITIYKDVDVTGYIWKPMITKVEDDTTYESYQGQQVTIDLGEERYSGVIDVLAGTMTLLWKSVTITGEDYIGNVSSSSSIRIAMALPEDSMTWTSGTSRSGKLKCSSFKEEYNDLTNAGAVGVHYRINGSHQIVFSFGNDIPGVSSVSDGITWMNNNPQQVLYYLATPLTIQLSPSQMGTLLGQNNIWADTGDVAVEYRADTKLFIQGQIAETAKVTRQMIADSATTDGKAPKSLATGDLIIVGDELRKATANIGNGSAITASNSTTATLADVIKALQ